MFECRHGLVSPPRPQGPQPRHRRPVPRSRIAGILLAALTCGPALQAAPPRDWPIDDLRLGSQHRVHPRIVVELREALSRGAREADAIRVFHGREEIPGRLAWKRGGRRVEFIPQGPLDDRESYRTVLSDLLERAKFQGPDWITAPCFFPASQDADEDGLPDCWEREKTWYKGLPLHAYGARVAQTDLFVEIDYMVSGSKPWITPRREALEKVRDAFLDEGYHVHFDVGTLYDENAEIGEDFNLGGGGELPFAPTMDLPSPQPPVDPEDPTSTCDGGWASWPSGVFLSRNFFVQVRDEHFDPTRVPAFYYLAFISSQSGSASGKAHRGGTNALVSFGASGWTSVFNGNLDGVADEQALDNQIVNYQAGTMMHELGHCFGIGEGGSSNPMEADFYKPNYVSTLNWLYQNLGLPDIGSPEEGDRYWFDQDFFLDLCADKGVTKLGLVNGPFADPDLHRIGYSHGLGAALDENDLDESLGLGQPGSSAVDYDCDDAIGSGLAHDTNFDASLTVLEDHDDWGSLVLYHRKWFALGEPFPADGLPFPCPRP